jgi:hypothetical protein
MIDVMMLRGIFFLYHLWSNRSRVGYCFIAGEI